MGPSRKSGADTGGPVNNYPRVHTAVRRWIVWRAAAAARVAVEIAVETSRRQRRRSIYRLKEGPDH